MHDRWLRWKKGCWGLAGIGFFVVGLPFTIYALWGLYEAFIQGGWAEGFAFDPLGFASLVVGLWLIKFAFDSLEKARETIPGAEPWRQIRSPEPAGRRRTRTDPRMEQ